MLTARSLILGKIETTYNVDAQPSSASDCFLVGDADIRMDPNVLERNFYRNSISPLGIGIGRKLVTVTFSHEVKASGSTSVAPKLGTFLRACGMAQTQITASAASSTQTPQGETTNTSTGVSWAKVALATSHFTRYKLRVVAGGASTVAKIRVTGDSPDGDATILPSEEFAVIVYGVSGATPTLTAAVDTTDPLAPTITFGGTVTTGEQVVCNINGVRFRYTVPGSDTTSANVATGVAALIGAHALINAVASTNDVDITYTGAANPSTLTSAAAGNIALGASGATLTLTFTTLVLNDEWTVDVLRPGFHYTPVSSGFESLTLWVFFDGALHKVTGCRGTVSFSGEAGNFASANFTFTGQYIEPQDAVLPTNMVYESSQPQQGELAQARLGLNRSMGCAQSWSLDLNNTVTPKDCINQTDGFSGVDITARQPQGGINPESTLEGDSGYWRSHATAEYMRFHVRVGTVAGNRVYFISESAQLSGLTYTDRNGVRAYDMGLRFAAATDAGDDEVRIVFA
jgi:hypothetical protein